MMDGHFGEPLDLSRILPAYRQYLGGGYSGGINYVDADHPSPLDHELETLPDFLYSPDPVLVGNGPTTCATTTALSVAEPAFAWDTNGYYASLGVPFPYVRASSSMLSKAYLAVDGQRSARATYCLTQLLDRQVRRAYDATPLGAVFLADERVQADLRHRAHDEASRRSQGGVSVSIAEVLDEWGFLVEDGQGLDETGRTAQDISTPRDNPFDPVDPFEPIEWTYAYWVWGCTGADTVLVQRWQSLLVSALSARGSTLRLAVGLMGRQYPDYLVGTVGTQQVVYLNDQRLPTPSMAACAADDLLAYLNP